MVPYPESDKTKLGGLDLSRRQKSISLDVMDNLDGFQKLVSTIEKSRSRSRFLDLVSMSLAKALLFSRDRDFSRLIEIFVIICAFCGFLDIFLDLDREIT